MSEFNTNPGSDEAPRPGVREAAIRLLADLDGLMAASDGVAGLHLNGDVAQWGDLTAGGSFEAWLGSIETLRRAVQFERTAAPEVADPALAQEGIALIRRSAPPGELRPEHIVAVTDAADVALAQVAWAELRWEADQRAIKRWHEAGGNPMVWPDHADLVLWLLEALEFRPPLPPIGDVQALIAELDRSVGRPSGMVIDATTTLRRRAVEAIRALAKAVIDQGRALYVEQRTVATLGEMVEGLAAGAEQRDGAGRVGSRLDDGQAQGVAYRVGVCRVCGCTEEDACQIPLPAMVEGSNGCRSCGWADATKTLCDNPVCLSVTGGLDQVSGCEDALVDAATIRSCGDPVADRLQLALFHCDGEMGTDLACRVATFLREELFDEEALEEWGIRLTASLARDAERPEIVRDARPSGQGGPHGDECECSECWEPVDLAAAVLAHSTATVDLGDGPVEITIRDGVATLPDGSTRNVRVEGGDAK